MTPHTLIKVSSLTGASQISRTVCKRRRIPAAPKFPLAQHRARVGPQQTCRVDHGSRRYDGITRESFAPHVRSNSSEILLITRSHRVFSEWGSFLRAVFVLLHSGRLAHVLLVKTHSRTSSGFSAVLSLGLRRLCGFYSCHMAPCRRKLSHMGAIQTRVVVLIFF